MKILNVNSDEFNKIWDRSSERNPFQHSAITDLCKPKDSQILNLVYFDQKYEPLVLYTLYITETKSLKKYFSCNL